MPDIQRSAVLGEAALLKELTSCETQVWEALVNGDQDADARALAAEFLGVYSDGFAGKADHVQQLADGPTVKSYALSGLRVMRLGPDCALLSYRADYQRLSRSALAGMYVSSIWRYSDGAWINIFSQDTVATD